MNYWLIADTHFGHVRMKEFCNRPDGFEYKILRYIREYVGADDVLIHLGDIVMARGDDAVWHEKFMNACAGKKWLVRGNHDCNSMTWYLERGWDVVADELVLRVFNQNIKFTHCPFLPLEKRYNLNIHGHHHNNTYHEEVGKLTDRHILIKCEHEYRPVNLERVLEKVREGKWE